MSGSLINACTALGQLPKGERLERIEQSPNYVDGQFVNLEPTEVLNPEHSNLKAYWDFLFNDWVRLKPEVPLSQVKTDLASLNPEDNLVIWLGHSSLYMQLDGLKILVDPVLEDYAAPLSFLNTAFKDCEPYSIDDFTALDLNVAVLTHDHYDHLEVSAIKALAKTDVTFICPLGVGQHLEYWGVDPAKIIEGDWGDTVEFAPLTFDLVTARHFSGRFITRNKTLWTGYVITLNDGSQIYLSGDTGYGKHFKAIGEQFPRIFLTLMECGQYNESWPLIHISPENAAKALDEVHTQYAIPIHSGRFALSSHPWDEPFIQLSAHSAAYDYKLLTPIIGQPVYLDGREQHFDEWWVSDAAREKALLEQK